jgi:hypothetical protein
MRALRLNYQHRSNDPTVQRNMLNCAGLAVIPGCRSPLGNFF